MKAGLTPGFFCAEGKSDRGFETATLELVYGDRASAIDDPKSRDMRALPPKRTTTRVLSRARRARDAGVVGRASTSSRSTARRAGARPRSCAASAVGGGKREWRGELESEHRVSATADLVGPRHPFLLRATLPAQSSSLRHTTAEPLSTVPPAAQAHRRGPAAVFVWRCTTSLLNNFLTARAHERINTFILLMWQ